jgi:hypothetical protein
MPSKNSIRYAKRALCRAAYFTGKACVRCGSVESLELDHIDPATKVHHTVWDWSPARRETELAKCQVLCPPCHIVKTIENGEHRRGEQSGQAKLTETSVLEIRALHKTGQLSYRELGRRFAVAHRTIQAIVGRETWKHI